jgi:RimJ/RimL family protein N-acetyltransferase
MALLTPEEPIRVGSIVLRQWEAADAEWYVSNRDEEIFRWTTEPRELSTELLAQVIRQNRREPQWVGLAIADASNGVLLGNIALKPHSETTAEIMYWLAPQARGRGAATDAVAGLCAWAFASLHLDRILLKTHSGNTRSRAVASRAGFLECGVDGTQLVFERARGDDATAARYNG